MYKESSSRWCRETRETENSRTPTKTKNNTGIIKKNGLDLVSFCCPCFRGLKFLFFVSFLVMSNISQQFFAFLRAGCAFRPFILSGMNKMDKELRLYRVRGG